jgi:hypothetical protein
MWSSLGAAGAIPLDAHPLRPGLSAPPGAVDVSGRGLRAGRPPDSPRGPRSGRRIGRRRRCIVATAAAVAQAPERDPPAGIDVPFRPRRASSEPPCGGRPGQDEVLDRATTPPETSSRPRRRLRPHPRPCRRASPTSEAIHDKPTDPGTRSTTTGPPVAVSQRIAVNLPGEEVQRIHCPALSSRRHRGRRQDIVRPLLLPPA